MDSHGSASPSPDIHRSDAVLRQLALKLATVEARDSYTSQHQRRVGKLAHGIAKQLGFSAQSCRLAGVAGEVHDIGKIGVPLAILTKVDIDSEEREILRQHVHVGYAIVAEASSSGGVAAVVMQHHERCDGSGYPRGLRAHEILPEAKVVAVADVFESMVSDRPYRRALPPEHAVDELRSERYDRDTAEACLVLYGAGALDFLFRPYD
jgi:HD-GYP domain-containing protein (c-di-GMP phosphodiesterase class II)